MNKKNSTLKLLNDSYGVCRLAPSIAIPKWCERGEFFSITKTSDELSIVCAEKYIPNDILCERTWKILKIVGPLDFSLVGILASISSILAQASISIFAVSTYDTDYILIKNKDIDSAIRT